MSGSEKPMAVETSRNARVNARLPGRSIFPRAPPRYEPLQGSESLAKREIEGLLSRETSGWDQRVSDAIRIPERLNVSIGASRTLFSAGDETELGLTCDYLLARVIPTEMTPYGIVINRGPANSFDFVLVDPERRIIVRDQLSSRQTATYSDWQGVARKIENAARLAAEVYPDDFIVTNVAATFTRKL